MLTKEDVLQAVARAWCHKKNANKEIDHDLAIAIAEEILALRGMGGEAVALPELPEGVVLHEQLGKLYDRLQMHQYAAKYAALCTSPAAPANGALAKQIRELGASIPCATGGTFENDPPDAIIDVATRLIKGVAAAALGGVK